MIEKMVSKCVTCAKDRRLPTEPLMSSSFPSRPWERLAMDLLELHDKVYLIVIDYNSRTNREQKSRQPVFGKRCLRPEGDLRIARYT